MACQGNPPVHTGSGLLEFGTTVVTGPSAAGQTVTRTTRLSLYTAAPFDHWGYHASALIGGTDSTGIPGSFDLTAFPLHPSNDGTSEPFVRYASAIPFWRHGVLSGRGAVPHVVPLDLHDQHEVQLFARDPAEQAATLRSLSSLPSCAGGVCGQSGQECSSNDDCKDVDIVRQDFVQRWDAEWSFGRSPWVPRMMYPPRPNLTTLANGNTANPPDLVAGVIPSDFWAFTPTGPGAAPDGSGSIKAVKIINHGVCGAFQPYATADGKGLLQQFVDGLPKFLLASIASGNSDPFKNYNCIKVERQSLVLGPYLDITTDQEDAQHGGFLLGAEVQIKDPLLSGGGPHFDVYFDGAWRLFDGRLTTQGELLRLTGQGTGFELFEAGLPTALTREMDAPLPPGGSPSNLAEGIWSQSYALQKFKGIPIEQPEFTTCTPRPDGRVVVAPKDQTAPCEKWREILEGELTTAASGVGASVIGLDSDEQTEVVADDFDAKETVGNDTVWKNIRCADVGDKITNGADAGQPTGPICYYELPAKRLNVHPDGVELVFLDQLKELDNPVYPIWLTLLELEAEGKTPTLSPLCDDPLAQTPGALDPQRTLLALPAAPDETFACMGLPSECGITDPNYPSCCCTTITVSP